MSENTLERLKIYLDSTSVSVTGLEKKAGFSNGSLSSQIRNNKSVGIDRIEKILAVLPELNPYWLLTGNGHMTNKIEATKVEEPNGKYYSPSIPLVTQEAIGGKSGISFSIGEADIQDHYRVPDFKNIQFMIRVQGSSMYPKYTAGDIVACRVLNEPSFIQWNKVHLIATREQGILIKRLKKGTTDERYTCVSDNKEYDPFEIPTDQITGIALVIGVIRVE